MSRQSVDPKAQLAWRLEALMQDGSLTTDRSASRNSKEAAQVLQFIAIEGPSEFRFLHDKTKSPEENAKLLIAAISVCFVEQPNKPEEAEGLVIEGGAAAVRERLETRLASEVGKALPAVTPYAARLQVLEDLYEATKDSDLEDLPLRAKNLAPPVVGASCRIEATGRGCQIVLLKANNKFVVVDLDGNAGDDGDAFEQVTILLKDATDFNPPRRPIDNWEDRFKQASVKFLYDAKKQKKGSRKWSHFARVSAKAALDAHEATADKDSAAARDAAATVTLDLARSYYCAVADETEALVLERLGGFKGDQGAIREWLAPCAARAALKMYAAGKTAGDASALVEGYKKATEKSLRVRRRSKLGESRRGPSGDERAPRNLYYQYVYRLLLAGNLTPACPWESLTGLKKDPENPPSFTGE
jgi:hypothetical protein